MTTKRWRCASRVSHGTKCSEECECAAAFEPRACLREPVYERWEEARSEGEAEINKLRKLASEYLEECDRQQLRAEIAEARSKEKE